jgi:predicted DNA-binding transcriptional regulator AlpA
MRQPDPVTLREAAKRLGMNPSILYRWADPATHKNQLVPFPPARYHWGRVSAWDFDLVRGWIEIHGGNAKTRLLTQEAYK